jgi:uncharacterized protein (DUF362 family)
MDIQEVARRFTQEKRQAMNTLSRRDFLICAGAAGTALAGLDRREPLASTKKTAVALVKTDDRREGVKNSLKGLSINPVKNKDVLIKPNFNTADECPGSTHNDTLVALVEELWAMGAKSISLGERSYPPTQQVMEQKGIVPLMKNLRMKIIDFDSLPEKDWVLTDSKTSHWEKGFRIARPILESECLVSTCCLKTHQYGGVFTMSLKLHVGCVPTTRNGYNYMSELHSSPHMRKMIAEINAPFQPALIVLDGLEAFVDGGPMAGKRANAGVFLASTDRVATDAVGVAILKSLGSNSAIMKPKIFEQEQIARAAELGLGVTSHSEIEMVAGDEKGGEYGNRIQAILKKG